METFNFYIRNRASEAEFPVEIKAHSKRDAIDRVALKFPGHLYTVLGYFRKDKYISPGEHDYSKLVNSPETEEIFLRLCAHEERCLERSVMACLPDIMAALNLDRELKGHKGRVFVHGLQNN